MPLEAITLQTTCTFLGCSWEDRTTGGSQLCRDSFLVPLLALNNLEKVGGRSRLVSSPGNGLSIAGSQRL